MHYVGTAEAAGGGRVDGLKRLYIIHLLLLLLLQLYSRITYY